MATQNQHKPNDFTPVVAALNHLEYVLLITDNPKHFPDCARTEIKLGEKSTAVLGVYHQDSPTTNVRRLAHDIYQNTFIANYINLKRQPWRVRERLERQEKALALCDEMLAEIYVCRKHFHLSTRRIKHWGKMVVQIRRAIEGWHDSDKDRFKGLLRQGDIPAQARNEELPKKA